MYHNLSQQNDVAIQKTTNEYHQIISMLIHELRNPLSLIKGTLQYIEVKHSEVGDYKYWDQLPILIQDMEQMLSSASLLNAISNLNIKNINFIDLINHVVECYMPQVDNQQKHLIFKPAKECVSLLSSYPCDYDKIKQALSNLLKNALEATCAGNFIEILLDIESTDANPMLSIKINNNGALIPEDKIDSIFLPFVTHKQGGTGIGLALVKRIIDAHMGSISVSSADGLTSFSILLPLTKNV